MKPVLVLLVLSLFAVIAYAQTVYKVPAATKGNTLVLTVVNESTTGTAGLLTVRPVGSHAGISITPERAFVKQLAENAATEVPFSIDVHREAKINSQDTLLFEISDQTGIVGLKSVILHYSGPVDFRLDQNFPNPFNPTTTINFDIPEDSWVSIEVFDILGREVTKLVDETKEAGYHVVKFDTNNLASGAYIYRMEAQPVSGGKRYVSQRKLMILR